MSKRFSQGFTLIELLVVIAIIGILSSVVLASLNTARGRGADAAIRSNLNNVRAQAELIYDTANGTYVAVCADAGVGRALAAAAAAGSGVTVAATDAASSATAATCQDSAGAWAMMAPLRTVPAIGYCVDSTGAATTTNVQLGASDFVCG